MDTARIRELMALIEGTEFTELEVREGEHTVRLVRGAAPAIPTPPPRAEADTTAAATSASVGEPVPAPVMGTFYRAPAPGAAPFVAPGDRVEIGTVLCILESMKMMNQVESELAGTIREVRVEDGAPVDTGQALFIIEPDGL